MNDTRDALYQRILNLEQESFESLALDIFRFQSRFNLVYRSFIENLKVDPNDIVKMEDIPCLPIQFFKQHVIKTGKWNPVQIFRSSGTTGSFRSVHAQRSLDLYHRLSVNSFESVYGNIEQFCFLGLLPGYLERTDASLVEMVQHFIDKSPYSKSGFYLDQYDRLLAQIIENQKNQTPTIVIGVTFALLKLANDYAPNMEGIIIMETGGMKGQGEEWDKSRLHRHLQIQFKINQIHSEYGMTELTSQCYARKDGIFNESPSLRIRIKEVADPFNDLGIGKTGVINLIDIGNLDTCSFIETQDLGKRLSPTTFELHGRLDHSDIRGCNLMVL